MFWTHGITDKAFYVVVVVVVTMTWNSKLIKISDKDREGRSRADPWLELSGSVVIDRVTVDYGWIDTMT